MAHFFERNADGYTVLAIEEHAAGLGFGRGGDDDFEDGAVGVYGTVERGRCVCGEELAVGIGRAGTEEEVAGDAAASVAFREVGSVGMNVEDHAGAVVADDSIGVSGEVVEETGDLAVSVLGGLGLFCGDGTDGDESSGVNGTGVEEGGASDGLDSVDAGFVEEGRIVGGGSELGAAAVHGFLPVVRCVLGTIGWGVLELV